MSGKRVAKKPKKKIKKRTLFTVFSMFNLFWYTVAVLVCQFPRPHDFLRIDRGMVLSVEVELPCFWYQDQGQVFF